MTQEDCGEEVDKRGKRLSMVVFTKDQEDEDHQVS